LLLDYIKIYFDYAVWPTAPGTCTAASAVNFTSATPACTVDTATSTTGFYIKLAGTTVSMYSYTAIVIYYILIDNRYHQ
jgi:hypothetical protein